MISVYEIHEIANQRIYLGDFSSIEDFFREIYPIELYNEDRINNHTCAMTYEEAIVNKVKDVIGGDCSIYNFIFMGA